MSGNERAMAWQASTLQSKIRRGLVSAFLWQSAQSSDLRLAAASRRAAL